jgi:cytochrome c556
MLRVLIAIVALAVFVMVVLQRSAPEPGDGPRSDEAGWTGLSEPDEVIEARRVLMIQMEPLMRPIDEFTAGGPGDPPGLRAAAAALEAMLMASAHLFPPTTNQFDPAVRESPTYALPDVWEHFETFRSMFEAAETAAATMAAAEDEEALRTGGRSLRTSCDNCHAVFTRPYTPPQVTPEDLEFDFDSMFPPQQ